VRHIAFVRNVNQGQRGHPSAADILAAFADAGAEGAAGFQSNGTVVFTADDPHTVMQDAMAALSARSGLERDAFWMPLPDAVAVAEAHGTKPDASRRELTLHNGGVIDRHDPAVQSIAEPRRCKIVDAGIGWIVSVNERDRESNATPVAEMLTGGPATSRGLPTLVRLIDRFAV
jgi:uncharacterized protein (DUF1697 family)